MSFFCARRYGESILTVSLRGLITWFLFAGRTVYELNHWLNWSGGMPVNTDVRGSMLCSTTKLGKVVFLHRLGGRVLESEGKEKVPQAKNLVSRSHNAKQKVEESRQMKNYKYELFFTKLWAFNSMSVAFLFFLAPFTLFLSWQVNDYTVLHLGCVFTSVSDLYYNPFHHLTTIAPKLHCCNVAIWNNSYNVITLLHKEM